MFFMHKILQLIDVKEITYIGQGGKERKDRKDYSKFQ